MKKDLLLKTVASCLLGAAAWCVIDFVICTVKKVSFTETFFTVTNLIEMAVCIVAAGVAYYTAQKKKQGL